MPRRTGPTRAQGVCTGPAARSHSPPPATYQPHRATSVTRGKQRARPTRRGSDSGQGQTLDLNADRLHLIPASHACSRIRDCAGNPQRRAMRQERTWRGASGARSLGSAPEQGISARRLRVRHHTARGKRLRSGLAAYGGIFVAGPLDWGIALDGFKFDRWDYTGAIVCLIGLAVIMVAPRG